jgi:N-acylneuraminate cytidylyltransferase/CMP-N,N'-diacetyllegionaminic acid synthase
MVVLIPARGGSKGLPKKNITLLDGKPLIVYSIECALACCSVSDVYVSTDCENIKRISEEAGAKVPFIRPSHLASDDSLAIDTYLHFINYFEEELNVTLNSIIILLPTSPLRKFSHIEGAIELFCVNDADSVISYTRESHPISWHREIDENNKIKDVNNLSLKNRQDENLTYYPNGSIYIFKSKLLKLRKYYSKNSYAYLMDRKFSVDIDYKEDFEYVEYLINKNGT